MTHARERGDVGFFWRLLEDFPAAEAATGEEGEAEVDVIFLARRVTDAFHADRGRLGDALRPVYIDYLLEHGS